MVMQQIRDFYHHQKVGLLEYVLTVLFSGITSNPYMKYVCQNREV
jgi:hypothetical protein